MVALTSVLSDLTGFDRQAEANFERDRPAALGRQLVVDLYRCGTEHLDDLEWVRETLIEAARRAHATIVESVFHKFSPWGISGVVVISESHLAVHIWPERRYAAVDVFTCGASLGLHNATQYLIDAFQSADPRIVEVSRGGHDHMIGLSAAPQPEPREPMAPFAAE